MEVGDDANTGCSCLWHNEFFQCIQDSRLVETADPTCQFCMLEEFNFALTKHAGQRTEAIIRMVWRPVAGLAGADVG